MNGQKALGALSKQSCRGNAASLYLAFNLKFRREENSHNSTALISEIIMFNVAALTRLKTRWKKDTQDTRDQCCVKSE